MEYFQFDGSEIIADVLMKMPEAQEILLSHGVACATCHINAYETLEEGIVAHYDTQTFVGILQDLNEAAEDLKLPKTTKITDGPHLTKEAVKQIKFIQEQEGKQQYGLKVEVLEADYGGTEFLLDLEERPKTSELEVLREGIRIISDQEGMKYLKNAQIDYVQTKELTGFEITKP